MRPRSNSERHPESARSHDVGLILQEGNMVAAMIQVLALMLLVITFSGCLVGFEPGWSGHDNRDRGARYHDEDRREGGRR